MKDNKSAIHRIKKRARYFICGRYLASLDEINRQEIYIHFETERLERKYNDVKQCYLTEAGESWHQTLFSYFFQYLGDPVNKKLYKRVAQLVGYNAVLRERATPKVLEALLLGASGLLKDYHEDHYTIELKHNAEHMMHKYNITPLSSRDWNLHKVQPKNHPVLRLAQAAAFFARYELFFDLLIDCRCIQDVEALFSVEASEYWTTHYVPAQFSSKSVKRLGSDKCNILGINLVVMIQYAYGTYTSDEVLLERAQNLIEDLKPETNWIVNRWRNYGIKVTSAFESQALIQIGSEYCTKDRCADCLLGARACENLDWLDDE